MTLGPSHVGWIGYLNARLDALALPYPYRSWIWLRGCLRGLFHFTGPVLTVLSGQWTQIQAIAKLVLAIGMSSLS